MAVTATNRFEETRDKVQKYLNAKYREEIIFTKSATEAINLIASSFGEKFIKDGGEFNHGFTYSGHPVAAAVALENLKIIESEELISKVSDYTIPYFASKINTQLSGFSLLIFLINFTKIYFSELLGYIERKGLIHLYFESKKGSITCLGET